MRYVEMLVTPEQAAVWLSNNPNVRTIRKHRVNAMVRVMKAGKWRSTHQGIAIGAGGELKDGQHRLTAVVMSGCSVLMWVAFDADGDDAIDSGMPRSMFERIGSDRLNTAIAMAMLTILGAKKNPQAFEVELLLEVLNPHLNLCEQRIRAWRAKQRTGTAGSLAAMLLLVATRRGAGDFDEMLEMMSKALSEDLHEAPRSVIEYFKQMNEGVRSYSISTRGSCGSVQRFCRAWVAMQPKNKDLGRIQIKDPEKTLEQPRKLFKAITGGVFE